MNKIIVNAEHQYPILIDVLWLEQLPQLLEQRTRVAVIYSSAMREQVKRLPSFDCDIHYFEVPDGESAKTSATLQTLWNWLGAAGFTRSDLIIGIGGGTITDLAGFAAATWLRGIDWIAIPTTLAGMVDAAIGGKTGINSDYGKNLIGAFHSPQAVVIDSMWLHSLSDRDFAAGMAEVIKTGFIGDGEILNLLRDKTLSAVRADSHLVINLITKAATVKANVVGTDFKESFEREILNYGHTLGHAIEKHSAYKLRHGEAVAIGLVFAAQLANVKGVLSSEIVDLHRQILESMELPISYSRQYWSELYPLLALDKKSRGRSLRFVGITDIGNVVRIEDASESELATAYERISS